MINNFQFFFVILFGVSFGLNLCFFFVANKLKTDIFTDIIYSLTYIIISTIMLIMNKKITVFNILIYISIILWAIRLGSYLFIRILKMKSDKRFAKIRSSSIKFFVFWMLQAISIPLVGGAAFFGIYQSNINIKYVVIPVIFITLAILGIIYEGIADWQKNQFYKQKNRAEFMKKGLWKLSLHPNYFGELCFWYFISIFVIIEVIINSNNNYIWFLWMVSPIWINILLVFISGVPLVNKEWQKKYNNNAKFWKYYEKTPTIIPFLNLKKIFKILQTKK